MINLHRNAVIHHKATQGWSLFELVIVLLLISLLACISLPSYRYYIRQQYRQQAEVQLLQISIKLEKIYQENHSYKNLPANLSTSTIPYKFHIFSINKTHYTLEAIPIGSQPRDPCGTLTLDSLSRTHAKQINCWNGQ